MDLKDYLEANVNHTDDVLQLFIYAKSFLESAFKTAFEHERLAELEAIIDKVALGFEHNGIEEASELRPIAGALVVKALDVKQSKGDSYVKTGCSNLYISLIKKMMELHTRFQLIATGDDYSSVRPLIITEMAAKSEAISLLQSAKDIISSDLNLPPRLEKSIIGFIDKAIANLQRERTDWARYYGTIREAVIILAALTTIAGGARSLISPLLSKVKQNLESAQVVIETSIVNQQFIQIQTKTGDFLSKQTDIAEIEDKTNQDSDKDETKPSSNSDEE